MERIKRNCVRLKNLISPNAPRTVSGVASVFENEATMLKYGYTCSANPVRFYVGCEDEIDYGFVTFKSQVLIDQLAKISEKEYYIDGTFRVVPNGEFAQLLVLHYEYKGQVNV